MKNKRVLIIEEDDLVRGILYHSLAGLIPTGSITAEASSDTGLDLIANQEFDILIADMDLIRSSGNLWGQIWVSRGINEPTIIGTSFTEKELIQTLLPVYCLLPKPIQLVELEKAVSKLLEETREEEKLGRVTLAEEVYKKVSARLSQLQADTSARCILLCDPSGRTIHLAGDTNGLAIDEITTLLSGGIATLLEAGKNLEEQSVINLAYREGKIADLYAINIKDDWIMIIVIDRGQLYQRLGTVWFYARKATLDLNLLREELNKIQPQMTLEAGSNHTSLQDAYIEELDKLFL